MAHEQRTRWPPRMPSRASRAAAAAGLLLAGCGVSTQSALNELSTAARQSQGATAPLEQLMGRGRTDVSELLDERLAQAVYAYLPCIEAEIKASELMRSMSPQAPLVFDVREPPQVSIAQAALDRTADLFHSLVTCVGEEARERVVEKAESGLKDAGARLRHAFNDYFNAETNSTLHDLIEQQTEEDRDEGF